MQRDVGQQSISTDPVAARVARNQMWSGFLDNQRLMIACMLLRLFHSLLFLGCKQGLLFRFPVRFLMFGHNVLLRVTVKENSW